MEEATQIYNALKPTIIETMTTIRSEYPMYSAGKKREADALLESFQGLLDGGPRLIKRLMEQ